MDEFQQVAEDLVNLEVRAKNIVFQMAKTLCIDLNVDVECNPKPLASPVDLQMLAERIVAAIEQVADRLPNLAGPPMTVEQVAEFASVSEKTIYRWVNMGRLKPKADGARPLLFERSEVEKALSSRLRT